MLRLFYILLISFSFTRAIYHYDVSFRGFSVGKSIIEISKDSNIISFSTTLTTNKFFDKFYSIRDTINVLMSSRDWTLLETKKNIKEGSFRQYHHAKVDTLNQLILFDNDSLKYSNKIYDPLGLLFFLRHKKKSEIKESIFNIYDAKKKIKIKFDVVDGKKIKFNNKNYKTFFLDPKSVDGKNLLKNNGQIRFWFSEQDKIPIQIRQTTSYGKIMMKLINIDEK